MPVPEVLSPHTPVAVFDKPKTPGPELELLPVMQAPVDEQMTDVIAATAACAVAGWARPSVVAPVPARIAAPSDVRSARPREIFS